MKDIADGTVVYHPEFAQACLDAMSALSCDHFFDDPELYTPDPCISLTEGKLALGATCTTSAQCEQGDGCIGPLAGPSTCQTIPQQGQPCTGYCPAYLYCDEGSATPTCVPQLAQGALCDPAQLQCQGVCDFSNKTCGPPLPKSCEGNGAADAGVDGGSEPPSCAAGGAGMTDCGQTAESCCTNLPVSGDTFSRTYTNTGSGPTGEADLATVSAFRLDKYPVTVGRFRSFVAAWSGGAGWSPPAGSGKHAHLNGGKGLEDSSNPGTYEPGWNAADDANISPTTDNLTTACSDPTYATWTSTPSGQEELPINCVNWYEAYAFCIWDGGFLPSEAEQECAAAGGRQEREYPWGAVAPGATDQYANYGCYYPDGSGTCTGVENIAPVGTASDGAGRWGQLDLAGSVFEWGVDWYAAYAPCTDCAYLTPTTARIGRGGFYNNSTAYLPPTYRIDGVASYRGHGNGFRCARTP